MAACLFELVACESILASNKRGRACVDTHVDITHLPPPFLTLPSSSLPPFLPLLTLPPPPGPVCFTLADQRGRLNDQRLRRLRLMDEKYNGRGVVDVHNWIANNRASFRGEVLGPVGLEITCTNALHAGFLEQQCGKQLFWFIVRCRSMAY